MNEMNNETIPSTETNAAPNQSPAAASSWGVNLSDPTVRGGLPIVTRRKRWHEFKIGDKVVHVMRGIAGKIVNVQDKPAGEGKFAPKNQAPTYTVKWKQKGIPGTGVRSDEIRLIEESSS